APETWCRTCRRRSGRPAPGGRRPRVRAAWRGGSRAALPPVNAGRAMVGNFRGDIKRAASTLRRAAAQRPHWHMARVTKISVGHSLLLGERPSSRTRAGHFCSDWVSRLLPDWKPLPRQTASAAAWQSGAPFGAVAQRSWPLTARVFGKLVTV